MTTRKTSCDKPCVFLQWALLEVRDSAAGSGVGASG